MAMLRSSKGESNNRSSWRIRHVIKPAMFIVMLGGILLHKRLNHSLSEINEKSKNEQQTKHNNNNNNNNNFGQHSSSSSSIISTNNNKVTTREEITTTSIISDDGDNNYELPTAPYYDFTKIVKTENLAQAFQPDFLPSSYDWCTAKAYNGTHAQGLLYNKMPKAASSTIAGVTMRLSKTQRDKSGFKCPTQTMHMSDYSVGKRYKERNKKNSLLFSSMRDPKSRAMSRIFFTFVSYVDKIPSDDNVIEWLRSESDSQYGAISPGMGGFQLAYMSMEKIKRNSAWNETKPDQVLNPKQVHETVRKVIDDYDLIMLVHRLDESFVAMQLLLGMETKDILYLSSKQSGGYYFKKFTRKERKAEGKLRGEGKCVFSVKPVITPGVEEYFSSKEWYSQSYGDYLLIEAASQSLDLTIDALGRDRFNEAYEKFIQMKEEAEQKCGPTAIFPCSVDGNVQEVESRDNCYLKDAGCGYPCLDDTF